MDNEFSQILFQKLLMFQYCIPGSAGNLWLLSKELSENHMQGIDNLEANEAARGISDMHLRSGKKCRTLVMFAYSQFQQQVYSHLSCSYTNTLRQLALSG